MILVESYKNGNANILLGLLKRWLPINRQELSELLEIEFEAILPGRKQHDQRYTQHPNIQNFLDEIVRVLSVDCIPAFLCEVQVMSKLRLLV